MRFEQLNTCKECGNCMTKTICNMARKKLRDYVGIRFTADGFDCALPVALDSHSICSYGCLYCFSDNLLRHAGAYERDIGQTSLKAIERLVSGGGDKKFDTMRVALRYDKKKNGYPCPIQLGALNDPCDNIERQQGWLLQAIPLFIKYKQPIRISTKGILLRLKDYKKALEKNPELFWVAFSIITPDDTLIERIDIGAPNATERLKTMKSLSAMGVKTALRMRPIFPHISDATKKYPKAYKTLLDKARKAGAVAVSLEAGFLPHPMPKTLKKRWVTLSRIAGIDYISIYKYGMHAKEACSRPHYLWTENIMHSIVEHAHKLGMIVGVSDPIWKQLSDTGCCCGILPDDKIFGNWQPESATNQLLIAKNTGKTLCATDIIPPWAYNVKTNDNVVAKAGPKTKWKRKHYTWAEHLRDIWNDAKKERSPLHYFQGALKPVTQDKRGNVSYKYIGLKRQYKKSPHWRV
jgi:DNA repair photolyase